MLTNSPNAALDMQFGLAMMRSIADRINIKKTAFAAQQEHHQLE